MQTKMKNLNRTRFATSTVLSLAAAFAFANVTVGPQIRIDPGRGTAAANETSIAASTPQGFEIVGSWNDWSAGSQQNEVIRSGVALSSDGGATWTDFLLRPPANMQSGVEGDPYTIFDHRTGNVWAGAISFAGNGGVYLARKTIGANTFQPSVAVRQSGSADKIWGAAGIIPGNPSSTRLYVAYNLGVQRSDDLGSTWTNPLSLGSGLGFAPWVGPQGDVYVTYWDFSGNRFMLRRSTDGGNSFLAAQALVTRSGTWGTGDPTEIPGNCRVPALPCIVADPISGRLYVVYFDRTDMRQGLWNVDLYLMTSNDRGVTWSAPVRIEDDGSPADEFFPWACVDRSGRLHIFYLSTRMNPTQLDSSRDFFADAYYTYSDDGGATFSRTRLTPQTFNYRDDGLNRSMDFIGDYEGIAYAGNRVYPCYNSAQNGDPDIFSHVIVNHHHVGDGYRVTEGAYLGGTADSLARNDSNRLVVESRAPLTPARPSVGIEVDFTSGLSAFSRIDGRFDLACTGIPSNNIIQRIQLLNTSSVWETVDERAPSTGDSIVQFTVQNAGRFLLANRKVTSRVQFFDRGAATPRWEGRIDEARLTLTP